MSGHPTLKARARGLVTKATRKPTKAEDRALIGKNVRANYPHWDMMKAPALAVYHGAYALTVKVHRKKIAHWTPGKGRVSIDTYLVTCERMGVIAHRLPDAPIGKAPKFPYKYACDRALEYLATLAGYHVADLVQAGAWRPMSREDA